MADVVSPSVTVNDFISHIRRMVSDVVKIEYTDEEILEYLNDALNGILQTLVARRAQVLIKKITVSSFPYQLPERFLGIYTITDGKGNEARLIDPVDAETASSFSYYLLDGYLYVKPDDVEEVTLYYYERPVLTQLTDSIPFYYIIGSGLKYLVAKMLYIKQEMRTPEETNLAVFYNDLANRIINFLPQRPRKVSMRDAS